MQTSGKMASSATSPESAGRSSASDNRKSQIEELRKELAAVARNAAKIAEEKATQAKNALAERGDDGLDYARSTIRSNPVLTMSCAILAGAALAVAVTRKSPPPSYHKRLQAWIPDIPDADDTLHRLIAQTQAAAARSSLPSRLERVVDSLSSIDSRAALAPAIEKLGNWLSSVKAGTTAK